MGAWIEIFDVMLFATILSASLPLWERGLKWPCITAHISTPFVAPPVGAWIEIRETSSIFVSDTVAPPVGAWIEINSGFHIGLRKGVAPPVGAWIEIQVGFPIAMCLLSRSPCGSVD